MSIERVFDGFRTTVAGGGYTAGSGTLVVSDDMSAFAPDFTVVIAHDNGDGTFTKKAELHVSAVSTTTLTTASEGTDNNAASGDIVAIVQGKRSLRNLTGRVLLQQLTASSSASLDFASWYDADFDEYEIEIVNLIPATDLSDIYLRFSTNGGSSYDAGSNYAWSGLRNSASGVDAHGNNPGSPTTQIDLDANGQPKNTSTWGVCGFYKLFSPGSTSLYKRVVGEVSALNNSGEQFAARVSGVYLSTTAVNALRIIASSGNLASGIVRIYGVRK